MPHGSVLGACPVADRPHGLDQVLVLGAELGPQPPDVHVHGPGASVEVVAPHLAKERRPGVDATGMGREDLSSSNSLKVRSSGRPFAVTL